MRKTFAGALVAILAVFLAGGASATEGSHFREAVRSEGGVVATESPEASRMGLEVLNGGGNAMDAAVATAFALNVARPQSCGIGGGGFLVYRSADGEAAALDFRETAPEKITPDAFQGDGIYNAYTGHKTVGVPGMVAGMQKALQRYGTISLAEAIAPAEGLAREGVAVSESTSEEMGNNLGRLELFPETREQFLVNGEKPYEPGSTLVQPELADTLALISARGPKTFYEGKIAEKIVSDMRAAGDYPGDRGLMTRKDLAAYEAKWRAPLIGEYRGRGIVAMPPPTSGGVATIEMLNILEGYGLAGMEQSSADSLHLLAEAQKIAFADREEYLADTDFVDVPVQELTSKDYANQRRSDISMEEAGTYEPGNLGPAGRPVGSEENPEASTTHLSIIDAEGNAVALTCTIEQSFGSAVTVPGAGFLLNNELTDFGEPGTANEPEPGKRPLSSISPTIVVEDGVPSLVVGGAGGSQIIMGVLHAIVNSVDYGMDVAHALDAPRLDAQEPPTLILEDGRVSAVDEAELVARGHEIEPEGEYADLPRVQAASVDSVTGERLAVTDPRSGEQSSLAQSPGAGSSHSPEARLPETGGPPLREVCGAIPSTKAVASCAPR